MRIRLRKLRYLMWAWTREDRPDRAGDAWLDRIRAINAETRQARADRDDDQVPHTPVTSVHRPGIYVDGDGRTVVRDRWGTETLGAATDMEVA